MISKNVIIGFHKEFVDYMYPKYGIENHPGYINEISLRPMLPEALIDDGKIIYIRTRSFGMIYEDELENTLNSLYHESGHFLHISLKRQEGQKVHFKPGSRTYRLEDILADLGAMIFLKDLRDEPAALNYISEKYRHAIMREVACDLFKKDKNLFRNLVSCNDFRKARRLLLENVEEKHYKDYFGAKKSN